LSIFGVVVLDLGERESFSQESKEMLDMYLATIGTALENVGLYQELGESFQKLKRMDKMRSEFIDMAAHELRTPLTSIKIYIDLMSGGHIGKFSKNERSTLEDMNLGIDKLNKLINEMLDYTRTESKLLDISTQDVILTEMVGEVVDDFSAIAKTRQISLEINSQGDTTARTDIEMIKKVFNNLIANAIKYSDEGGNVFINVLEEEDHVAVAITDTGIGISKVDLPHIFERFYMGDSSLTKERDQMGLGLSIVKSIVERHDGRIWAESEAGKGSTFHFTLPKQKDEDCKRKRRE
jgi:signal transduction histidine kinase